MLQVLNSCLTTKSTSTSCGVPPSLLWQPCTKATNLMSSSAELSPPELPPAEGECHRLAKSSDNTQRLLSAPLSSHSRVNGAKLPGLARCCGLQMLLNLRASCPLCLARKPAVATVMPAANMRLNIGPAIVKDALYALSACAA